MGFIVYNETTYPRFVRLLDELGVATQPSDMSLGSTLPARARSRSARAAPAASSPTGRWRRADALADVRRHRPLLPRCACDSRLARSPRSRRSARGSTIARYGRAFREHFLVPIIVRRLVDRSGQDPRFPGVVPAALPRQPRPDRAAPVAPVAHRHRRLAGPTSTGSSPRSGRGAVRAGSPVMQVIARRVRRDRAHEPTRHDREFDAVIMATHVDVTRRSWPTPIAARATCPRRLRLHDRTGSCSTPTPASCPDSRRAWGSWNVETADCRTRRRRADDDLPHEPAPVAARAGRLLRFGQSGRPTCATRRVIVERAMSHPLYTFRTLGAQERRRGSSRAIARRGMRRASSATAFTRTVAGPASRRPRW